MLSQCRPCRGHRVTLPAALSQPRLAPVWLRKQNSCKHLLFPQLFQLAALRAGRGEVFLGCCSAWRGQAVREPLVTAGSPIIFVLPVGQRCHRLANSWVSIFSLPERVSQHKEPFPPPFPGFCAWGLCKGSMEELEEKSPPAPALGQAGLWKLPSPVRSWSWAGSPPSW